MFVKLVVFNRQSRLFEIVGNLVEGDDAAFDRTVDIIENDLAGAVVNFGGFGHLPFVKRVKRRNFQKREPKQKRAAEEKKNRHQQKRQLPPAPPERRQSFHRPILTQVRP